MISKLNGNCWEWEEPPELLIFKDNNKVKLLSRIIVNVWMKFIIFFINSRPWAVFCCFECLNCFVEDHRKYVLFLQKKGIKITGKQAVIERLSWKFSRKSRKVRAIIA